MTILPADLDGAAPPETAAAEPGDLGRPEKAFGSRLSRIIAMPLFLLITGGLLAFYIGSKDLDGIETQKLNREVITDSLMTHLELTAISTVLVILIGVPLGVALTRRFARPVAPVVLAIANVGQAVPSIGVLALFAYLIGLGADGVIFALVVYCLLSVLRNTITGIEQVSPALIEAARGMGMSRLEVLLRIELPLAVPVMMAGIRTALIINVGTATLATFTIGGPPGTRGLGDIIVSGLTFDRNNVVVAGAAMTAGLALLLDWAAGLLEDWIRPKGLA